MSLYDPGEFPVETETKVVSPDFTLQDVLDWARTKPRDEKYDFSCPQCALGQFLVHNGHSASYAEAKDWWNERDRPLVNTIFSAAGWESTDWTFGAFADRLERALS